MTTDSHEHDPHEHARILIALSGPEDMTSTDRTWLAAHLESCAGCHQFADNTREAIQSLRGISVTADVRLVSATQLRVRQRALELQGRQERLWVVAVCCAAVTVCTVFATVVLWLGFAWLGAWARLDPTVWAISFAAFSVMPSVITGMLLLARGTHLADRYSSWQGRAQ